MVGLEGTVLAFTPHRTIGFTPRGAQPPRTACRSSGNPPRSSDPPAGHQAPPRSSGTPQPLEGTSSGSTARAPPARSSPISPPGAARCDSAQRLRGRAQRGPSGTTARRGSGHSPGGRERHRTPPAQPWLEQEGMRGTRGHHRATPHGTAVHPLDGLLDGWGLREGSGLREGFVRFPAPPTGSSRGNFLPAGTSRSRALQL